MKKNKILIFILYITFIFIFTSCFKFTPDPPTLISKSVSSLEIKDASYGLTKDKVLLTFKNTSSKTVTIDKEYTKIIYNGLAFNVDIISSQSNYLTIPPKSQIEFQFKTHSINNITKKFSIYLVYKQMGATKTSNYSIYLN